MGGVVSSVVYRERNVNGERDREGEKEEEGRQKLKPSFSFISDHVNGQWRPSLA